jgi:transposase-like protein
MKNLNKSNRIINKKNSSLSYEEIIKTGKDFDARIALIQELIPLGLMAVSDRLKADVEELAGPRYKRNRGSGDLVRWGSQMGSVYLSDQKVKVEVPRVRNRETNREVELPSYKSLQTPHNSDLTLLKKILHGISCRNYEETAGQVPEVFGISASSVSKRFKIISTKQLKKFNERRLEQFDFTAIVIDGKTFADDQMIVAVGVTIDGEKKFLGFIQASTENARVVKEFLESLIERGLSYKQGLLFIIDGSKGINKAIKQVFGRSCAIQRCQWHKRENVVSYLPKSKQALMRKKLQKAYEKPTYKEAKTELIKIRDELMFLNESAANSLDEGLEETLTLHRLGVFVELGISLKTTNCIESINSQIGRLVGRVTYWKNSNQKHRWLASALLEIEPRLRRIKGYKYLPMLRQALQRELKTEKIVAA